MSNARNLHSAPAPLTEEASNNLEWLKRACDRLVSEVYDGRSKLLAMQQLGTLMGQAQHQHPAMQATIQHAMAEVRKGPDGPIEAMLWRLFPAKHDTVAEEHGPDVPVWLLLVIWTIGAFVIMALAGH